MTHPLLTIRDAAAARGDAYTEALVEIAMGGCVAPVTMNGLTTLQIERLAERYGLQDDGTCAFFGVRGIATRECYATNGA